MKRTIKVTASSTREVEVPEGPLRPDEIRRAEEVVLALPGVIGIDRWDTEPEISTAPHEGAVFVLDGGPWVTDRHLAISLEALREIGVKVDRYWRGWELACEENTEIMRRYIRADPAEGVHHFPARYLRLFQAAGSVRVAEITIRSFDGDYLPRQAALLCDPAGRPFAIVAAKWPDLGVQRGDIVVTGTTWREVGSCPA